MSNPLSEIVLEGDKKSFAEQVIKCRADIKPVCETLSPFKLPFEQIRHLFADRPLRFAPRRIRLKGKIYETFRKKTTIKSKEAKSRCTEQNGGQS